MSKKLWQKLLDENESEITALKSINILMSIASDRKNWLAWNNLNDRRSEIITNLRVEFDAAYHKSLPSSKNQASDAFWSKIDLV